MDALVLIPVGALVVLASLRFDGAAGRGWKCVVAVGLVVAVFLGARALIPDETMFFASEVSRRVRAQVDAFRKSGASDFLVVEGSSVVAHGCDPEVLKDELEAKGVRAGVLQFSAQGANHFERTFLMEAFWRGLNDDEKARLKNGRVVLAREVFDSYDRNPLYLFDKDSYTERAKVYMSPGYGWAAWNGFLAGLPEGISIYEQWQVGLPVVGAITERVLLNRFGAGSLSGMDWRGSKRKTRAFFAMEGVKGNFDYERAAAEMRSWDDGSGAGELPAGWRFCQEFLASRNWEWVDEEVYFAMPSLEGHRRRYQLEFRESSGELVQGPPGIEEMKEFLGREKWFDGVHPTGAGAKLFSKWLAEQLAGIMN